jgi:excisionase family DNA binding protein
VADEVKRRFLTTEQVAEELNVGLPLVRTLLKSGELRAIQIGGRGLWRVATSDLEEYISQAYRTRRTKLQQVKSLTRIPSPRCTNRVGW